MTLIQKLVSVYEKIDHIDKTGHNKNQNYDFVRAADMVRAVRKALFELGVYAEVNFTNERQYTIPREKAPNAPFAAVDVRCDIVFHDSESTDTIHASGLGTGADTGDKAIYKAMTGAIKYGLRSAFLVPDEADPEADEAVDERPAPSSYEDLQNSPPRPLPLFAPKPQPGRSNTAASSTPSQTSTAPAPAAAAPLTTSGVQGALPTDAQFAAYRVRFKKLGDELSLAGLKASGGVPSAIKLKVFMLQVASVNDPKELSIQQWEKFFALASETPASEFIKIINAANGVEK